MGEASLARIQAGLVKIGTLILFTAILLGLILSRGITRPILELVRGAVEMEHGNYEYPLDISTRDEIGYLADRFLEMREHERTYVNSLEESARLKSDFLAVAAHELRTPVSIVKAYSEVLSDGSLGPLNGEQEKTLEVIGKQLDGIEQIIEDAALIAQVEGERTLLNIAEHDIQEIVNEALKTATAEATDRNHVWVCEIAAETGSAHVDGPRLVQAITHLLRNAIRFTPDKGRIEVRALREGEYIVIEVEDSGVGIAQDKRTHVFDRSFMLRDSLQHHSSRALEFNSAGLGLGLPLARGIVEAHGGAIRVESSTGRGSTFTILIPSIAPAASSLVAA